MCSVRAIVVTCLVNGLLQGNKLRKLNSYIISVLRNGRPMNSVGAHNYLHNTTATGYADTRSKDDATHAALQMF